MPNPLHCLLLDVSLHSVDLDGEQDLGDDGMLDKEGTTFTRGLTRGSEPRQPLHKAKVAPALIVSRDLQNHSSCCYLR
jgi:hypothetical protein